MTNETPDDAFAEQVAEPLRAAEYADATFEARAMSAVHAAARGAAAEERGGSWWRRPSIHLSPLALLATAAGVALMIAGAALLSSRASRPGTMAAAPDTVHVVRFVFTDSSARAVALVGEFNQWNKSATALHRDASGFWVVELPLRAGRHEYAFVVQGRGGERWVADPFALTVQDEFGTESSIISVGAPRTS